MCKYIFLGHKDYPSSLILKNLCITIVCEQKEMTVYNILTSQYIPLRSIDNLFNNVKNFNGKI